MESRSSILRISDAKTLELIELYKEERCLWNTGLPSYRNRANRFAAAKRIAKTLDLSQLDARHVIIKLKNLRNSYCQELKKVANSLALAEDPVYQPKVFWFQKMDSFLRPHLQQLHPLDYDFQQKEDVEVKIEAKKEESKRPGPKHNTEVKNQTQLRHDSYDIFGKYVSSMLRMMPEQKAMEVQPKIVTLLTSVNLDSFEPVTQSDDLM